MVKREWLKIRLRARSRSAARFCSIDPARRSAGLTAPHAAEGLEPLLVLVGGGERFYDEGVALMQRANQAGVVAELAVAPELPHNPPVFADYHPAAADALERLARYVGERLSA